MNYVHTCKEGCGYYITSTVVHISFSILWLMVPASELQRPNNQFFTLVLCDITSFSHLWLPGPALKLHLCALCCIALHFPSRLNHCQSVQVSQQHFTASSDLQKVSCSLGFLVFLDFLFFFVLVNAALACDAKYRYGVATGCSGVETLLGFSQGCSTKRVDDENPVSYSILFWNFTQPGCSLLNLSQPTIFFWKYFPADSF